MNEHINEYVVIDDEIYPANTPEELKAAQEALVDVGQLSARIWVGDPDCPDSYASWKILFQK